MIWIISMEASVKTCTQKYFQCMGLLSFHFIFILLSETVYFFCIEWTATLLYIRRVLYAIHCRLFIPQALKVLFHPMDCQYTANEVPCTQVFLMIQYLATLTTKGITIQIKLDLENSSNNLEKIRFLQTQLFKYCTVENRILRENEINLCKNKLLYCLCFCR